MTGVVSPFSIHPTLDICSAQMKSLPDHIYIQAFSSYFSVLSFH